MENIISEVSRDLGEGRRTDLPPYPALPGYVWIKGPDVVYEDDKDMIWEGEWEHVPERREYGTVDEKTGETDQEFILRRQKEQVAKTFAPHLACHHTTHDFCTNSWCCDLFRHEGYKCQFDTRDEEEKKKGGEKEPGYAQLIDMRCCQ